ncbi:TPA: hypothetical protein DDZ86_00675 [Candidatus Dependentiae bacterium]|nr:MAG: hypothetical protein UW09_C0004G0014 [candidate division TM6 bacterium GW2011_GWF2_43_87]HBL98138.1 hypothetical protein [Candidatus Dependentiae bacterium]
MKLSPTGLMMQSIVYSFSNVFPWFFVVIGAVGSVVLTFLYNKFVPLYPATEYAYEFLQTVFSIWWYLAVSRRVLPNLGGGVSSTGISMKQAMAKTVSVWWLVIWLTLLQWAMVPLLQRPYCYGEGVDLLLFILIMIILVFQLLLNFSIIPAVADGHVSFKMLYINALDFVRRQFAGLIYFLVLIGLSWCGLMMVTSFLVFLFKGATECIVTVCWEQDVAKIVIVAFATSISTLFLAVAQTLFYVAQSEESARWDGERHLHLEV